MSIASRIQSILTKRLDKVEGYSEILKKLDSCHDLIAEANTSARPIIQNKAFVGYNKITELSLVINSLNNYDASSEIASLKDKIVRAKQRCGRSYVNIGILAPWRHGKSQFLCQLFRLKPEEEKYLIPTDSDKQRACTGTTVNYLNGDTNVCVFEAFKEEEVVKAIIDLCRLSGIPAEDLMSLNLEELVTTIKKKYYDNQLKDANENTPRQALREYIIGYNDYESIIRKGVQPIEFTLGTDYADSKLHDIYQYICFYNDSVKINEVVEN